MVKNTKTWISSRTENIFPIKQKNLNLSLRWHILRIYSFVVNAIFKVLIVTTFTSLIKALVSKLIKVVKLKQTQFLTNYKSTKPVNQVSWPTIGINMADILKNWLNWFHFPFLKGCLFVTLIDCMIFPSPFLDVTRMSISTVSFLAQLDSGILCLWNAFLSPMILVALSLELSDRSLNCRCFLSRFPVCSNVFVLLFL